VKKNPWFSAIEEQVYMRLSAWSRGLIIAMAIIAAIMIMILGFHWFGPAVLKWGLYSQLFGAILGGIVAIVSVNIPIRFGEEAEPWLGNERLAWTLLGAGSIMWGIGECIYRYLLAHNLPNFPALSDVGYSSLPPLMFIGLLLQPSSGPGRARLLVILDSLISMGSILAIAWFLLLGSMAAAPGEANLAKFLGLYYPITDMALLSCVIFLITRGQGRVYQANARRLSLLLIGIGLCVFAVSDFNYNIQNNMGTYIDGTWADLGWPLGLMIIGLAAHLRRFIPATSGDLVEERIRHREESVTFGPAQLLPYVLLGALFLVLVINVLSNDPTQIWNRPVLLVATLCVVTLVVIRQLNTQLENERLSRKQSSSLERLAMANARVEEQARLIADHNANLEDGIGHLKEIQAQLANGNLRARARISSGNLVSLAGSLNLMADRLLRFEQVDNYAQKLTRALNDLSRAFDQYRNSGKFALPPSCSEFPEIQRLLISMGMKYSQPASNPEQNFANGSSRPGSKPPGVSTNSDRQSLSDAPRSSSKSLGNPSRSGSKSLSGSQRSDSKPLDHPQRQVSQPLGNTPSQSGAPWAPRTPGLPLSAPDPRTGLPQRQPSQETPRPPSGIFDDAQLDFPPLMNWGDN
jgi:hypothetical protein